jgi:hypothetical protein
MRGNSRRTPLFIALAVAICISTFSFSATLEQLSYREQKVTPPPVEAPSRRRHSDCPTYGLNNVTRSFMSTMELPPRVPDRSAVRVLCIVLTHGGTEATRGRAVLATWSKECTGVVFVTNTALVDGSSTEVTPPKGMELRGFIAKYHGVPVDEVTKHHQVPVGNGTRRVREILDLTRCMFGGRSAEAKEMLAEGDRSMGYLDLWAKNRCMLAEIARLYGDEFDWFYKADDDTYTVMRHLYALLDPARPDSLGARFDPTTQPVLAGRTLYRRGNSSVELNQPQHAMVSGGAGYLLSRAALSLAVSAITDPPPDSPCAPCSAELIATDRTSCGEDWRLSRCLASHGVTPTSTLDDSYKDRFNTHTPPLMLNRSLSKPSSWWYFRYAERPLLLGTDACSATSVTWHYVSPGEMRKMFKFQTCLEKKKKTEMK